ncbi:MAG: hypothetical protein HN427_00910 [Flavobacteriales bacterium]|nr:hypothetical protein [Flavobacteriales bacterium]MBT6013463.1 hypothetical protein [Flavobacteriales bacterium]MBT7481627.1 hypothetical protein [Flavobacteriales bacterium]
MNKTLKSIIIGIVCISAISFWIYIGINKDPEIEITQTITEDTSNLIFKLINKDTTLHLDSLLASSFISYSDSTNYINILNNSTPHKITISEIAPYTTTDLLSLTYNKNTLKNYKTYLKNNNQFQEWDSVSNSLKTDFNFNISELTSYINEIGSFTCNTSAFYYLKSDEAYNVVSLLNLMMDSITPQIIKRLLYYKINTDNLFQLLAGDLFTENKDYYINMGDYFVFSSDTSELSYIYQILEEGNTLEKNPLFTNYKSKQYSEYGLNYYSDITKDDDTLNRILSYQLRGEQNGVISNFNIFYSEKILDTIIMDTLLVDTTITQEELLINDIVNSTIQSQEKEDLGEIIYTLKEGETYRNATVNLKKLLEENGYDYQKIKAEHIFFFSNKGNTKLDWKTAKSKYLGKGLAKKGDYFLMKKFYY